MKNPGNEESPAMKNPVKAMNNLRKAMKAMQNPDEGSKQLHARI